MLAACVNFMGRGVGGLVNLGEQLCGSSFYICHGVERHVRGVEVV